MNNKVKHKNIFIVQIKSLIYCKKLIEYLNKIKLEDKLSLPSLITIIKKNLEYDILKVTLMEKINRKIRSGDSALSYKVLELKKFYFDTHLLEILKKPIGNYWINLTLNF